MFSNRSYMNVKRSLKKKIVLTFDHFVVLCYLVNSNIYSKIYHSHFTISLFFDSLNRA